MSLYKHVPHPHIEHRKKTGPVTSRTQRNLDHPNPVVRFNSRFALICTIAVGSMWCAYAFAALAFSALPTALKPGNIGFSFWLSSDFFQLTLLSIIIVGQNILARASDKRAEQTYLDAEAVLHEALQIQAHLEAQDQHLMSQDAILQALATAPGAVNALAPTEQKEAE